MGQDNKTKNIMAGVDTTLTKDEVMDTAAKNQELLNEHQKSHGLKALSRRDFLSTGVISFSGALMSQNIFQMMIPETAQAALQCQVSGGGDWIPVITLNCQGGCNFSSHYIPLNEGGDLLSSYAKLGQGKTGSFQIDREFSNNVAFFGTSTLLAGLRTSAMADTLAKTTFHGIPVQTQDDSSNNNSDMSGITRAMGLNGKLVGNMGTANTPTGLGAKAAFINPPAPLIISSYESLTGALGVAGSLSPLVAANRAGKMFETIQNLSVHQAKRYVAQNSGADLENIITCRTADNTNLIANPGSNTTDPRANADVARVWNLQANTSTSSAAYQMATIVFNALNGNAGSGNINRGGADYHDGSRTRGDGFDNGTGVIIGQILQTAAAMGKKVFIFITSDGSAASPESDIPGAPWTNDAGNTGSYYFLAFNPSGALQAQGTQIGYMNNAQGAASPLISSADRAVAAAFVNWLSFNGKLLEIDKALPRTLNPSEIDAMKKIA